jgi:hypothetical protein
MQTAIKNKINEINSLIPLVDQLESFVYTYAGGTWPYMIDINPIQIDGDKVIITAKAIGKNDFISDQSYSTKDYFSLDELKYDLATILKAFKKALK